MYTNTIQKYSSLPPSFKIFTILTVVIKIYNYKKIEQMDVKKSDDIENKCIIQSDKQNLKKFTALLTNNTKYDLLTSFFIFIWKYQLPLM